MVDLVCATARRTEEPRSLLASLAAQTYGEFRLLVVDQNDDDRLAPILASFADAFPIIHLRSEPGASRARNVGLRHVEGDLVAFPDDDCRYPPRLLEYVAAFFAAHPEYDGLSGRAIDEDGQPAAGVWDRRAGAITPFNVWRRACAYTVVLRRTVVDAIGGFDETLGPGLEARWPAGEDLDYVLRSVRAGFAVYYEPELCVEHPQTREGTSRPRQETGLEYGLGLGRVLGKNGLPAWFAVYQCARPFGASGLSLLAGKPARARFHWAVGRGRVRGWRSASVSS